ncbi:MAG: DMT family transporter [Paludibacteraceae bacterium]|nr:DMT family transporter [Paludibacteraceae bacterium]
MDRLLPYIAIVLSMIIWSASGIAVKDALTSFSPLTLIVVRFALSVLFMFIIGLVARRSALFRLQKADKKDLPLFFLTGLFQPFLYYLAETYTYDLISTPTIAETLLSVAPVLAPLFGWVFLREKVTPLMLSGILVSTAGVAVLVLVGTDNFSVGNPWGVLLAIVAVMFALSENVVLRRIPDRYNPLTIIFYTQIVSFVLFCGLWAFTDMQSETIHTIAQGITAEWQSLAYLAVMSSAVAFMLYCYGVRIVGVVKANVFNNIRPVFTALIMFLGFSEQLPLGKWLGIGIIIVGLFLCHNKRGHK